MTLVDANGFQTFQPLLYQAATGLVDRADVEFPLSEIAGVDVVTGQVVAVDLDARSVTLDDGRSLSGDHLVLATGTVVNYFGVDGAAETALPLYTSADARAIKARLQQLVSPTGSFSVVVVGAGATGVEVTGAITDVVTEILPNTYPAFRTENIAVHLVDRADCSARQPCPGAARSTRGRSSNAAVSTCTWAAPSPRSRRPRSCSTTGPAWPRT